MSAYVIAGLAAGLVSAAVLGWLGRAARSVMQTAPEAPHREQMIRGARWLPAIIFGLCAAPAALGVMLLDDGSEAAVWLIAGGVAALGALMIAQRFAYWEFAGFGMATPEAIERTDTGEVDWEAALELARTRERGWVSRLLLPITGLIVIAGAIALPAMVLPAERELRFAEWLWVVDDEIEFATERLGKPQVWTDIGFEAKTSDRDYKTFADGGRVKLRFFAPGTPYEQVRMAVTETERVLTQRNAPGRWHILAVPREGETIEVVWTRDGGGG